MTTHHACFSNSAWCSGVNPCGECKYHIRMCVLTVAMRTGGFNGDEAQSNAFLDGYDAGWQRLHDAMMHDPNVRQLYVAVPVEPLLNEARRRSMMPQPSQPQPAAQPAVPVQTQHAAPSMPQAPPQPQQEPTSLEGIDLSKPLDLNVVKDLLSQAEKKAASAPAVITEVANPRVRNVPAPKPRTMSAEEIAAVGVPVGGPSNPSNGV